MQSPPTLSCHLAVTCSKSKHSFHPLSRFKAESRDLIIVDTSGRHKQSEALFEEMRAVAAGVEPVYISRPATSLYIHFLLCFVVTICMSGVPAVAPVSVQSLFNFTAIFKQGMLKDWVLV